MQYKACMQTWYGEFRFIQFFIDSKIEFLIKMEEISFFTLLWNESKKKRVLVFQMNNLAIRLFAIQTMYWIIRIQPALHVAHTNQYFCIELLKHTNFHFSSMNFLYFVQTEFQRENHWLSECWYWNQNFTIQFAISIVLLLSFYLTVSFGFRTRFKLIHTNL